MGNVTNFPHLLRRTFAYGSADEKSKHMPKLASILPCVEGLGMNYSFVCRWVVAGRLVRRFQGRGGIDSRTWYGSWAGGVSSRWKFPEIGIVLVAWNQTCMLMKAIKEQQRRKGWYIEAGVRQPPYVTPLPYISFNPILERLRPQIWLLLVIAVDSGRDIHSPVKRSKKPVVLCIVGHCSLNRNACIPTLIAVFPDETGREGRLLS